MEEGADLGAYHLTAAYHMIHLVYFDHLHHNDDTHLDGDVEKSGVPVPLAAHNKPPREVLRCAARLYRAPLCAAADGGKQGIADQRLEI